MSDEEVLQAIGRAIEAQARATRYVMAIGFFAVVLAIIFTGQALEVRAVKPAPTCRSSATTVRQLSTPIDARDAPFGGGGMTIAAGIMGRAI